jgi:hypothetical protein
MSGSIGEAQFELSYQRSPIILCGGIAQNVPGGVLPIIAITEADNFPQGLLGGGISLDFTNYFASFAPLPGGTLIENDVGRYPMANQAVAGNAIIAQPTNLSMLMTCPTRNSYATSLAIMIALRSALKQHSMLGGTYTVVTPKSFETNMLLLRVVDVSSAESKQAQNAYQWDFFRPLLTLQEAQAAQNSLMSKLSSGTQITGNPSYSGSAASVGQPSSLAGTSIPSAAGTAGASTAPLPTPSAPLPTPPVPPLGGRMLSI